MFLHQKSSFFGVFVKYHGNHYLVTDTQFKYFGPIYEHF